MALPYDLGPPASHQAAFGLILLETDETLPIEALRCFTAPGQGLFQTRIRMENDVTPASLAAMADRIPEAASLLPAGAPMAAVGYACTSGATVIGSDRVEKMVQAKHPTAAVSDPIRAAVAALQALEVGKLGFLTPYIESVSAVMRNLLQDQGFEIAAFGSFEQIEDPKVARISPASILEALVMLSESADLDALFIPCTNLQTFGVIEEAERRIGKPVVTSNQALCWHLLRLAGQPTQGRGPGRLFDLSETPAPVPGTDPWPYSPTPVPGPAPQP